MKYGATRLDEFDLVAIEYVIWSPSESSKVNQQPLVMVFDLTDQNSAEEVLVGYSSP